MLVTLIMTMFRIALVIIVILFCDESLRNVNGYQSKSLDKIVHGINAEKGEYPYAANILTRLNMSQHCGGSIISKIFVLTACHCVGHFVGNSFKSIEVASLLVLVGNLNRETQNPRFGQIVRYADMAFVHPNCSADRYGLTNDIGALRLAEPLQWSKYVQPLPLLTKSKRRYEKMAKKLLSTKALCTSIGWGMTVVEDFGSYSTPSNYLQKIHIKISNYTECEELLCTSPYAMCNASLDKEGAICAKGYKNSDVCKGDSGGPLICNGFIYGIISWAPACGEVDTPTMYTRIDRVLDFYLMFLSDY